MITNITITNRLGFSYTFDESNRLVHGLDLSGLQADVNYLETLQAGSSYQNTRLRNRSFELNSRIYKYVDDYALEDTQRAIMYKVINPELNPMRFHFQTSDGTRYYLNANATATPTMSPIRTENNRSFQNVLMQFLCTDPYIYEDVDLSFTQNSITNNETGLEFDLNIPAEGITFEDITANETNISFNYPGDSVTGFTFRLEANGTISNPVLTNVLTGELMRINIAMDEGDVLEVNTISGERSITYRTTGLTTNGFSFLDFENSRFLTISPGDNMFSYSVATGRDTDLRVFINYRIRRVGL